MDDFWKLTPAEFNGLAEFFGNNQKSEVQLVKAASYWTESLSRMKRMPTFDKWLDPPKPARSLTGEEADKRLEEHLEDVALIEGLKAERESDDG